jgi:hypothetical protein
MRQLVVLSGKGGTGKTTLVAAFAALAQDKVLADCDVDAADLHLLMDPKLERSEPFAGSKVAALDEQRCIGCGGLPKELPLRRHLRERRPLLDRPLPLRGLWGLRLHLSRRGDRAEAPALWPCLHLLHQVRVASPRPTRAGRRDLGEASDASEAASDGASAFRRSRTHHHRRPAGDRLPGDRLPRRGHSGLDRH